MANLTLTITPSPAAKERFDDIKKQNGGVPNAEIEEALEQLNKTLEGEDASSLDN